MANIMARNTTKYVYSTLSAVVQNGLTRIRLSRGEVWAADDPFVKQNPDFFSTSPPDVRRTSTVVETATAAPGQKRG